MKEVTNLFFEGDEVLCISDDFPIIPEYSGGDVEPTKNTPQIGEFLTVDEVLGDFIRFDKYDSDSINWWHWSRFVSVEKVISKLSENFPLCDDKDDILELWDELLEII